MKRIIVAIMVCALLICTLAACAGPAQNQSVAPNPPDTPDAPDAPEPPVLDEPLNPGEYHGVLEKGSFYQDGQEDWQDFYYVDLGEEQYAAMAAAYDPAEFLSPPENAEELIQTAIASQDNLWEIQLIAADSAIDLAEYAGREIRFAGRFFDAQTSYHIRYIVFLVEEITVQE
ncbi:MAG: hypothetical protein LBH21_01275 [Gracilibacteraceae bacterium]|jgi:hypothetical protein|nr:hypothetical protein [Gracilibacteraceae bacterium]